MNISLTKTWHVSAVVVSERYDHALINHYMITARMTTNSDDTRQQNIAYHRLNHWFSAVLEDSFLISAQHPKLAAYQALGERVIVLPSDPVDQLMGILLCCKMQAMVENRLTINDVMISSPLDDHLIYSWSPDDGVADFTESGWWLDASPSSSTKTKSHRRGDKVIAIGRNPEWKDYDLEWDPGNGDSTVITIHTPREDQ